jgi:hypothetical protein
MLTANCSWLSKSTLLSRPSGLYREHLVQGFSLSSTQRWLAYSVAVGTQQYSLCCLGSFIGSGMPMYLLPLKYAFSLWPLRSNGRHRIRLLGVASQYCNVEGQSVTRQRPGKIQLLSYATIERCYAFRF